MAPKRRRKRTATTTSEADQGESSHAAEPAASTSTPAPASTSTSRTSDDVFNIFVATDLHVGFMEKDGVRGNDSFEALEEVLKLARENNVDFLLLGGDLFHEHKPSRRTVHRVMELFRRYCLGDGDIDFDVVSKQDVAIGGGSSVFRHVNFEDPNLNVCLPVFSIHGNHDDPSGDPSLAALDILSAAGLVNYFGKSDSINDITISPILLKKGSAQIALYGLGYLRDERLNRTFQAGKVTLMKPKDADTWFHLFTIHQNRADRNPKAVIREGMIPSFMDFVVWGHEHESRPFPEENVDSGFNVVQLGSTIATTLSEDESKPKHVGILSVKRDEENAEDGKPLIYRFKPIPLKSSRPFLWKNVVLSRMPGLVGQRPYNEGQSVLVDKIEDVLAKEVESMLGEYERQKTEEESEILPLVRLRVDYTGYTTVHHARFGQRFLDKVANPNEILLFHKQRASSGRRGGAGTGSHRHAAGDGDDDEPEEDEAQQNIDDLIHSYLKLADAELEILPDTDLNEALNQFVEKDDAHAFETTVDQYLDETRVDLIQQIQRSEGGGEGGAGAVNEVLVKKILSERIRKKRREAVEMDGDGKPQDMDIEMEIDGGRSQASGKTKTKKAVGKEKEKGKGKASKRAAVPQRSKSKRKRISDSDSEEFDSGSDSDTDSSSDDEIVAATPPKTRRTRKKK